MGYVIKHSTSNVNKARRKGKVAIGVDSDGYDKTSVSGFYAGVPPVEGKHNFVRTAAGGNPNFYSLTDEELINFVNGLGERNLTIKTPSQAGWQGSYSLTDSDTRTFNLTTQQNNAATTSAWRTWYWNVSDYIGQTVAISADVEFVSETNCTWRDIHIGQGNTGQYTTHIAGSDAADKVKLDVKPTTPVKMQWSGSINATGIVGFTQWINNVTTNGANAVIKVSNVQIEANGHVTEFSNPDAIVYNVLEAKNYLNSRSDIIFTDNVKNNNIVTDGLILNLNAKNKSSFIDNEPTINLLEQPSATSLDVRSDIYNNVNKTDLGNGKYEFTNDGTGSTTIRLYCNLSDLTDGETYACSVSYEKFDPGDGSSVTLDWCDVQGVSFPIGTYGSANRISIAQSRSTYSSTYRFFDISLPTNSSIVLFDAQVEQKSSATSFTSGSRSQNTTWYDLSGNGDATAVNSPVFSNDSFTFDQTNEYFSLTNNELNNISGSVTLMGVCKQGSTGSPHQTVLCTDINYRNGLKLMSRYHGAAAAWIGNSDGTNSYLLSSGVDITNDGKWHHLTTTRDNSTGTLKIYVDGILKNSVNTYTGATSRANIAAVGVDYHSSGYYYIGNISSVKAYDQVLTDSEIKQNYYGGDIVTDNLVLAVDAGNLVSYESGSTTAYSMTGSLSGSLENGVSYLDLNGGNFSFDGTNDQINFGDESSLDFTNGVFSMETWINIPSSWTGGSQYPNLISKGAKAGWDTDGWSLFCFRNYGSGTGYTVGVGLRNSGTTNVRVSYNQPTDTWLHVVGTLDGSSIKIYVNGELKTSNTQTINPASNNYNVLLGRDTHGNSFPGKISISRLYNKTLTSDEVLQNYNAQKARFI